ncbi:MAG TPA: cupin domain-containing protein [Dyadobacter sp.]|jgi:quercetin dioxygenase-like cupin family protein|nr:cupin domain-containing protein [Dyadobacter sp.]
MLVTKRDFGIAFCTMCLTLTGVAVSSQEKIMDSAIFNLDEVPSKNSKTGSVKSFFRSKTATLEELECHVTTLNPGESSHAPHRHPNEEIIIIKEGNLEALVNGQIKPAGPGAVIFQASNQLHAIKNVGKTPATYHVLNWHSVDKGK